MFAALNSFLTRAVSGYFLNKSLRFRSSASAYLNRTPATTTNQKTFTWSAWVKRGALGAYSNLIECVGPTSPTTRTSFTITNTDTLAFFTGNTSTSSIETTQLFRDPAAWYHIVLAVDTTQATSSNRVKFYVNGTQITAFGTATYPAQNLDTQINNVYSHTIGKNYDPFYFDGELAEVNFVDGQALAPTAFGATGANSQWLPKAYAGTYGTNGFYLPFTNVTSTSTLVADSSGNANNWTPNNISLTAGSTYDSLTDVPTLTSTTVANYAVLNPLACGSYITLSSANLQAAGSSTDQAVVAATFAITTPTYWECKIISKDGGGNFPRCGAVSTFPASWNVNSIASATTGGVVYRGNGDVVKNNNVAVGTFTATAANDILGFALDPTAQTCAIYLNNTLKVTVTGITAPYFPAVESYTTSGVCSVNFGQQPFTYTAPSGFLPLNTFNI